MKSSTEGVLSGSSSCCMGTKLRGLFRGNLKSGLFRIFCNVGCLPARAQSNLIKLSGVVRTDCFKQAGWYVCQLLCPSHPIRISHFHPETRHLSRTSLLNCIDHGTDRQTFSQYSACLCRISCLWHMKRHR